MRTVFYTESCKSALEMLAEGDRVVVDVPHGKELNLAGYPLTVISSMMAPPGASKVTLEAHAAFVLETGALLDQGAVHQDLEFERQRNQISAHLQLRHKILQNLGHDAGPQHNAPSPSTE